MSRKSNPVNVKKLSKKYNLDVTKVIQSWKDNITDTEISEALHIDLLKLMQIRQEIEDTHNREREKRKRNY
ncbi:hypothetical protein SAMN00017405_1217 [Desulfonispora thiosulfatigenes DSM 11270]|uniref:Transposase n=1 Tax=Desulfonispora thiosulfatigenes DSM 11270 TaxID=656914 RepID=A0A1W1V0U5_DESTI|nr:hypothetical protein [Desulfonispora thiosulfatigenes]SMB86975.1 hypothetical protein SAMN00017405_1217 [Desulfonispora thiosulfatigenes DSM 11270]